MNLKESLKVLIEHEGGYSDHPHDPGGKTKYGVTELVARENGYKGDMKDFTLEQAEDIYKKTYWTKIRADELPDDLRFHVFDAAVNSGITRAIKWLQVAGGVDPDGIMGKFTVEAAKYVTPAEYSGIRLEYLTTLNNWSHFGKGWAVRIAKNLRLS
jgi:lysozyme family protein